MEYHRNYMALGEATIFNHESIPYKKYLNTPRKAGAATVNMGIDVTVACYL